MPAHPNTNATTFRRASKRARNPVGRPPKNKAPSPDDEQDLEPDSPLSPFDQLDQFDQLGQFDRTDVPPFPHLTSDPVTYPLGGTPPPSYFLLTMEEAVAQATPDGKIPLLGRIKYHYQRTVDFICDELEKGTPYGKIFTVPGMPARAVVDYWCDANPEFARRLRSAMERGFDLIAAECLEIADTVPRDAIDVQHQRLRVDTRMKLLAKWYPKKYGDSMQITGEITHKVSPLQQLREMRPNTVIDIPAVAVNALTLSRRDADTTPDGGEEEREDISADDCF